MSGLIVRFLEQFIMEGALEVVTASGDHHTIGKVSGAMPAVRFTDRAAEFRLLANPPLALGELYMEGRLLVTRGSIYDIVALATHNLTLQPPIRLLRMRERLRVILRRVQQRNGELRAKQNVAHHYDIDGRLYELFLDADRQYSCAYFESRDQSLEEAQLAKKRHIAAKLLIEPGHRVLDIGSGWGGLGLYLAERCGAEVTGITLSEEQLRIARSRAQQQGVADTVKFRMQDYRAITERFDRIVSVGMFEHVGVGYYDTFFSKVSDLLADDGVMLLHAIGSTAEPGATNPWMAKYIFPGGYTPALSEVLPAIERAGLIVTDIEILRLHYAETLRAWRERFLVRRDEAQALYDERFCRMWEFYLAGCEAAFRHGDLMVFQIQLAKRLYSVPVTRDYVAHREALLRVQETQRPDLMIAAE
ncbi:MAG: cyclopropane-fatty-acyl-phospholipid synthase family protein [Hyphomicrobiaceae bacterium]